MEFIIESSAEFFIQRQFIVFYVQLCELFVTERLWCKLTETKTVSVRNEIQQISHFWCTFTQ